MAGGFYREEAAERYCSVWVSCLCCNAMKMGLGEIGCESEWRSRVLTEIGPHKIDCKIRQEMLYV